MLSGSSAIQYEQTKQINTPSVKVRLNKVATKTINIPTYVLNNPKFSFDFALGPSYVYTYFGMSATDHFAAMPLRDFLGETDTVGYAGATFDVGYEKNGAYKILLGQSVVKLYSAFLGQHVGLSYQINYREAVFDGSSVTNSSILAYGRLAGVTTALGISDFYLFPVQSITLLNNNLYISELQSGSCVVGVGGGFYLHSGAVKKATYNGTSYSGLSLIGTTFPFYTNDSTASFKPGKQFSTLSLTGFSDSLYLMYGGYTNTVGSHPMDSDYVISKYKLMNQGGGSFRESFFTKDSDLAYFNFATNDKSFNSTDDAVFSYGYQSNNQYNFISNLLTKRTYASSLDYFSAGSSRLYSKLLFTNTNHTRKQNLSQTHKRIQGNQSVENSYNYIFRGSTFTIDFEITGRSITGVTTKTSYIGLSEFNLIRYTNSNNTSFNFEVANTNAT